MIMSQKKIWLILLSIFAVNFPCFAKDYYVALNGNNENPGTIKKPFATIQKAADTMSAGDTCYIRGGIYRQTVKLNRSGKHDKFIKFTNYKAEQVILDGTDILRLDWSVYKGNIYKASTDKKFDQLFVDGNMMVEARWPNIDSPDGVFDKNTWAYVDKASLGTLTDSDLTKSDINDWAGGYGVFNISQQMHNWVRKIKTQNENTITYDTAGIDKGLKAKFSDDRYYLFGKLDALDFPGEWFLDTDSNTIYLWTKQSDSPANYSIAIKQRDYAFDAAPGTDYIELNGLHFFGCEFRFQKYCHYITIDDCHLLYPNYSRTIPTMYQGHNVRNSYPQLAGHYLTLQNCTIAHSLMNGIYFAGSHIIAKNNLLYDTNWNGSNTFSAMFLDSEDSNSSYGKGHSLVRDNTIFDTGNVAIKFRQPDSTAEYNNLFHGGLAAKDTTLLYTAGNNPNLIFQYNWLHDNPGWYGQGLGFRLDGGFWTDGRQTEKSIIRGNVAWNCPSRCFVIKGTNHRVYNNTVLGAVCLMYEMHQQTEVLNNYAQKFMFTVGANQKNVKLFSHNSTTPDPKLVNPLAYDFALSSDSPLIDTGITTGSDYQWKWLGKAPDIGAQEYGLTYRAPGYKPIRANNPLPQDKSKNVDPDNIKLTWSAPIYPDPFFDSFPVMKASDNEKRIKKQIQLASLSYNVYLGTDLNAVSSADEYSPQFKACQTKNSFDAKKLRPNTPYYWRIDTLDAKKHILKFGHIWNFYTGGEGTPIIRKFNAVDDTFIDQAKPDTIAGSLHNINISDANALGFIKFDVTNINGKVTSAKLKIHSQWNDFHGAEIYAVTGIWNENSLNWNNNKLTSGQLLVSRNNIKEYRWYEFDVTKSITANGSYTFGLKTNDPGHSNDWYSKEYNNGFFSPELIVTYSND